MMTITAAKPTTALQILCHLHAVDDDNHCRETDDRTALVAVQLTHASDDRTTLTESHAHRSRQPSGHLLRFVELFFLGLYLLDLECPAGQRRTNPQLVLPGVIEKLQAIAFALGV